mmetsp:Transcript_4047/g.11616  ORF Transcript_4047/g.11616 Transcript_4047/m.11616 type:complete len:219 (-) Transcript_4047:666-1322(-)
MNEYFFGLHVWLLRFVCDSFASARTSRGQQQVPLCLGSQGRSEGVNVLPDEHIVLHPRTPVPSLRQLPRTRPLLLSGAGQPALQHVRGQQLPHTLTSRALFPELLRIGTILGPYDGQLALKPRHLRRALLVRLLHRPHHLPRLCQPGHPRRRRHETIHHACLRITGNLRIVYLAQQGPRFERPGRQERFHVCTGDGRRTPQLLPVSPVATTQDSSQPT